MNPIIKTTIIGLSGALACTANAAVLVGYTFDRVSSTELDFSADTVAGISANNYTDTAGTAVGNTIAIGSTSTSLTSFFNLDTQPFFNDSAVLWENGGLATGTASDMLGAIAANQFMHFTMTILNPSDYVDLTNLTFQTTRTGGRGVIDLAVRSSVDGFASDLTLDDTIIDNTSATFETHTVDLSGAAFDNLTSPVEFRIYFDRRHANGNGGSGTSFDNIALNGELIPEPSSAALLCLGALGLIARRRR